MSPERFVFTGNDYKQNWTTLRCISLGKSKIRFKWIHFCERNEKSKTGLFRVIFLTLMIFAHPYARNPNCIAASLFMFQFFNELSNDDLQIYDQLVYRFPDEEVIPLLKATCSNGVKYFKISNFFEVTVPSYSLEDFRRYFRTSRSTITVLEKFTIWLLSAKYFFESFLKETLESWIYQKSGFRFNPLNPGRVRIHRIHNTFFIIILRPWPRFHPQFPKETKNPFLDSETGFGFFP